MKKKSIIQILALVIVLCLILNMILFALRKISLTMFWGTLIVFGIIAYKGIPLLRKASEE